MGIESYINLAINLGAFYVPRIVGVLLTQLYVTVGI
jgi:hypothetical protein